MTDKAHMCVTAYPTETKDGKAGPDRRVCAKPTNGYEARHGEALMNWGCDHPARPCKNEYVSMLSFGREWGCAVLADGSLACWGSNSCA